MRIECISNLAKQLPEELIYPDVGLGRDRVFPLNIGKEYVVYGITFYLGHVWYYVCDENNLPYPVWKPSPLFRITDNRLSSYWRIGIFAVGSAGLPVPIIAFDEWTTNPVFYDQLTDGEENAVAIFKRYKQLMDEEAGLYP